MSEQDVQKNTNTGRRKLALYAGLFVLCTGILFFLLRGPYLSNYTKRLIIPVLENATRERVTIDKAVINLFPFYIQAKGLKMFDKDGNQILWITKSRVYMDVFGLLSRNITIRKLSIIEPDVTADEEVVKRILENLRTIGEIRKDKVSRFSLKNIELTDGRFSVKNADGLSYSVKGLFFDMNTKNIVTSQLLLKEFSVKYAGFPGIKGSVSGKVTVAGDRVEVSGIDITSAKSTVKVSGMMHLSKEGRLTDGSLTGKAEISENLLHRLFGVSKDNETRLLLDGTVNLALDAASKKPHFTVDLKTDSTFYLETLLELLKVKSDVSGKIAVKGKITGTFPELSGSGTGELHNGILGGFHIESAKGDVTYGDEKFLLKQVTAHAYNGEIKGDGTLILPHADYTVDADASGISSPEFFKFIKWEPPFPAGRLNGRFHLAHLYQHQIEVAADAVYLNTTEKTGNLLGRLDGIKGNLHLKDGILSLNNTVFSTKASSLTLDGSIDLNQKTMGIGMRLDSSDLSDIVSPYYTRITGPVSFKGKAGGPVNDPEITGSISAGPGSIHGMPFTRAAGDLVYKIKSLNITRLNIAEGRSSYDASGTIEFKNADGLFSFKGPYYRAKAIVREADMKPFITALYRDIPVSGIVNGSVSIEGDAANFTSKSDFIINDSVIHGQELDKVNGSMTVRPGYIEFHSLTAQRGGSFAEAKGKLYYDKKFEATVSSNKIDLTDIKMFRGLPLNANMTLNLTGSGTVEKPDIKFSSGITESSFRGIKTGKGEITGTLKEKDLSANGKFINGLVTAALRGVVSKKPAWSADIDFHRGNYDFLLSGFFKKIPEDTLLSFEGKAVMTGDGDHVSMVSKLGYVYCTLYGYNLKNSGEVVLELADRNIIIKSLSMTGDNAGFSAQGSLKPDDRYDLKLNGRLNLASLKTFSDKFVSLRGQGDFTADITGPWNKPEVSGSVNLKDAAMSLTEYPYKVGPVSGTVFLQKDRFTFDSVNLNFGGGSILLSGVGYMSGFRVKRIFISSALSDVTIKPADKVSVSADGRLFYEMSDKGSSLSGNIDVKKGRYEKNVEWNKWLIDIRKMTREQPRYPAFLKDTALNVYITGSDNIMIDNNIAKAEVKVDLTLTGNLSRIGLLGRMAAEEGSIFFRSNEFKILEGSNMDFMDSGKITPVFHILAESYIGNYYIKLNLDGTMDKFGLSLFSDPPLSEMEILNLLTFGQTQRDSRGIESGIAASEAASILTGGIQDAVQEKFRNITGFERFSVEPHTTAAGSVSPRVTIGKRLLEDKLFVFYSSSIGTTEENIISLEYKVDRNISLVGSRDEIGSVGGDIKFRFEFK